VIALSEPTGANATLRYIRRYPEGPLFAGITGFYSQVYGRTELEQSMNTYLAGDAPELTVSTLADLVLGRQKKGGAVITTINARLQRVASDALGTQPGPSSRWTAERRRLGDGVESHVRSERAVVAGHRGRPCCVGDD
jgi:peptidoglycan glycosyltransferase